MSTLRNVVYLTEAQLEELRRNGTITVDGVTIDYSDDDLYVTPTDDFDGIYAKESDLTAVESDVLDNSERIASLESGSLVVKGKAVFTEANQDNHILNITIPVDIVKKLSTPFAAKVKIICLEQEMSAFDGVVSGTVNLANTPVAMMNSAYVGELVGTTGSGYVDIENPYGVIIDLSNANITISAGYHYFYKIEFIC